MYGTTLSQHSTLIPPYLLYQVCAYLQPHPLPNLNHYHTPAYLQPTPYPTWITIIPAYLQPHPLPNLNYNHTCISPAQHAPSPACPLIVLEWPPVNDIPFPDLWFGHRCLPLRTQHMDARVTGKKTCETPHRSVRPALELELESNTEETASCDQIAPAGNQASLTTPTKSAAMAYIWRYSRWSTWENTT